MYELYYIVAQNTQKKSKRSPGVLKAEDPFSLKWQGQLIKMLKQGIKTNRDPK